MALHPHLGKSRDLVEQRTVRRAATVIDDDDAVQAHRRQLPDKPRKVRSRPVGGYHDVDGLGQCSDFTGPLKI